MSWAPERAQGQESVRVLTIAASVSALEQSLVPARALALEPMSVPEPVWVPERASLCSSKPRLPSCQRSIPLLQQWKPYRGVPRK